MKKWSEFVEECSRTIEKRCINYEYLILGLYSEIGEVAGKIKKHIRGDFGYEQLVESSKLEIGDCLWYIAMLEKYCVMYEDDAVSMDTLHSKVTSIQIDEPSVRVARMMQLAVTIVPPHTGTVVNSDIVLLVSELEQLAWSLHVTLTECAEAVIEKLTKRNEIGTIKGNGDGIER